VEGGWKAQLWEMEEGKIIGSNKKENYHV